MHHEIELSKNTHEAHKFCEWLNNQGHKAEIGYSTVDYVDGYLSSNEVVFGILEELWEDYSRS